MDWVALGLKVAQMGLPVLGTLLGGPAGGAIGKIVATALGAKDTTPDAINDAIESNGNDVAIQQLKSAEATAIAWVDAQAKVAVQQSKDVNKALASELVGVDEKLTAFSMFQRGWRPAFAWLLIFECASMALVFMWEVVTSDFKTLDAISGHENFMIWWLGMQFSVLGVFSLGRSQEKVAAINATGAVASTASNNGLIGDIVEGVANKLRR